ncbi:cell wall hydrolase [Sphingomicrobium sp. XHP0239]|uniref:cell wall hydrolase n=1 Tax=Sphingomicrobium maritimum TaxID=3133972 RepID=UPI0031CC9845
MKSDTGLSLERIGAALVALLLVGALAWPRPTPAEPANLKQTVSAPEADVIDAATGEAVAAVAALGEGAELINADLPFAAGPNPAARGFTGLKAGSDAFARAQLCLTQAIYYEAGFEPIEGRRAVAQVVLNRVRHPAFPSSVCAVVYEGAKKPVCQFSFTCDGSLDRRPATAAWARARQIAADALNGKVEPSVGMSTHYHADYVAPRWAPMLAKTHKVGAHIFYRWPGGWGRPAAFDDPYRGEPNSIASLQRTAPPVVFDAIEELAEAVAPAPFPTREEDPTIRRAANDVGGLVDMTKEWRPSLPDPTDMPSAAERVAKQQHGVTTHVVAVVTLHDGVR